MTPELTMLTWVVILHLVCWVPYILNRVMVEGLVGAVGYPDDPKQLAPWAARAKKAHYNSVENLVAFAAMVLILHAVGISNETTVMACTVYFWARWPPWPRQCPNSWAAMTPHQSWLCFLFESLSLALG